jgi:alkyldihydroxyacetonephosphate synthase
VLDPAEARNNGVGDGKVAILVLGFESADHPLDAWVKRALELVADHHGSYDVNAVARSLTPKGAQRNTGRALLANG